MCEYARYYVLENFGVDIGDDNDRMMLNPHIDRYGGRMMLNSHIDRHGGRMDYVDTVPMPAEAATEIGVDQSIPEGFAVAALFVFTLLTAVVVIAILALRFA